MSGFYGDQFNNWSNPYAQQTQPQWGTPQLKTNKILVTSLEEAISKATDRYSETYFFDQNKPVFYIVRVDMNMVKSWLEVPYTLPNQEQNTPATKADLAGLEAKLNAMEATVRAMEQKSLTKRKKSDTGQEVTEDAESS